jgi:hypothetical protein
VSLIPQVKEKNVLAGVQDKIIKSIPESNLMLQESRQNGQRTTKPISVRLKQSFAKPITDRAEPGQSDIIDEINIMTTEMPGVTNGFHAAYY